METTNKGQRKFPIYADDGIGTMLLTMFLGEAYVDHSSTYVYIDTVSVECWLFAELAASK